VIERVKVVTLFWGSYWSSAPAAVNYFNGFFQELFRDGRYLLNLQQYSNGGYRISNGQLAFTRLDPQSLPDQVTDAQIRSVIATQIGAGSLPSPDPDTVYFVFTPPNVVVVRGSATSGGNFQGYHHYSRTTTSPSFAYAVIPAYPSTAPQAVAGLDAPNMTSVSSHELAEVVTNPQGDTSATTGWYDTQNGEVGDIVESLYTAQRIDASGRRDTLVGTDGTQYRVQKVWSNWDQAPVAFATRAFFPTDGDAFTPSYLTPARKSRNLLLNGSFEQGWLGWYGYSWRNALYARLFPVIRYDGSFSAILVQPVEDESSVGQRVTLKPNTRYLLSGWARTQGVAPTQPGGVGASLIVWYTYLRTQHLTGNNEWTYLAMIFNSGDQTQFTIGPDLGYTHHATGIAWFDDLCLLELP
jgi:hypothetical protein